LYIVLPDLDYRIVVLYLLTDFGDAEVAEYYRIRVWNTPGFGEKPRATKTQPIARICQGFNQCLIDIEFDLIANTIKAQFVFSQTWQDGV
jgi:hypothetical protein